MMAMPIISGSSAIAVSLESAKQRIRTLESENRRLMSGQGQLIADTNRKIEMHLNEIRILKDEIKTIKANNTQLNDLCCFLEEDRQKTRQLSKEWQRFGRYTSELMKQEITTYQHRLREQEEKHNQLLRENDELKRLCLYLDDQRQTIISQATAMAEENNLCYNNDNESSDAGCGSSEKSSSDSEKEFGKMTTSYCQTVEYDHEQEKTLRYITEQMQISIHNNDDNVTNDDDDDEIHNMNINNNNNDDDGKYTSTLNNSLELHNDRLFNYIQSLENRIQLLEKQGLNDNTNRYSKNSYDSDDINDIIDNNDGINQQKFIKTDNKPLQILSNPIVTTSNDNHNTNISRNNICRNMLESTTSTMTSSGTTYCSSETDESAATAVYIINDDDTTIVPKNLEVRTLGPIDEEQENDLSLDTNNSIQELFTNKIKKSTLLNLKNLSPLKFIEKRISSSSTDSAQSSSSTSTSTTTTTTTTDDLIQNNSNDLHIESELPPKMPLLPDPSTRLSMCSSNLSLDNCSNSSSSKLSNNTNKSCPEEYNSLGRNKVPPPYSQVQLRHRPSFNCPPFTGYQNSRQKQYSESKHRQIDQDTWETLNNTNDSSISAQITAV